ncbi:hypothetical protein IAU60_005861 [Kwoniella sp. DSM 27419]
MPSPSPGPGIPAAVPVPAPHETGSSRRRSRVVQSSLELAFSYLRHQELRYGGSVPSFIASSSSRSRSTPDRSGRVQSFDGAEEDELEAGHRDLTGRWADLEAAIPRGSYIEHDAIEEDDEGVVFEDDQEARTRSEQDDDARVVAEQGLRPIPSGQRRTSDEPSFFHSDPEPSDPAAGPTHAPIPARQRSPAPTPPLAGSQSTGTASAAGTATGRGLISINMFSPRVTPSALGTSYGTGSSGSQTPRLSHPSSYVHGHPVTSGRGRRGVSGPTRQRDLADEDWDDNGEEGTGGDVGDDAVLGEETSLLKSTRRYSGYGGTNGPAHRKKTKPRARITLHQGQSTDGQTLFNATAVLVGIGLLSLPLAFAYAGWIGGSIMLLGFGWLTCYTAKLLARLIRADPSLLGYTDIGVRALGRWAGAGIHVLFCLELFALGVALIVLFGDTLNVLFPAVEPDTWKLIGFFIVLPTALLPLRLLSLPSLLSSVSSLLLIVVLLIDGLIRPVAPGSLRHPMPTSLWPEWTDMNWLGGIGLVLAGFGGHAVMPSLARDMKHPERFDGVVNKAFAIATGISFLAGAAGYLMIGPTVSDEITKDLMQEKYHYPRVLNFIALWMIVINPLTKFGLSSRPLNITIEGILGISPLGPAIYVEGNLDEDEPIARYDDPVEVDPLDSEAGKSHTGVLTRIQEGRRSSSFSSSHPHFSSGGGARRRSSRSARRPSVVHRPFTADGMDSAFSYHSIFHSIPEGEGDDGSPDFRVELDQASTRRERRNAVLRVISRTLVTALCVITSVLLPGFGRVMAFLGSFSAFLICIILPLLFHLRLDDRSRATKPNTGARAAHWLLVGLCTLLMIAGTVWAFIPGSGHGEVDP